MRTPTQSKATNRTCKQACVRPAACRGGTHVTAAVVVLALFGSTLAPASAAASSSPDSALKLWFRQPAGIWEEALPVGNGRIGAMVYGGGRLRATQVGASVDGPCRVRYGDNVVEASLQAGESRRWTESDFH
jgi:hypothetical protein